MLNPDEEFGGNVDIPEHIQTKLLEDYERECEQQQHKQQEQQHSNKDNSHEQDDNNDNISAPSPSPASNNHNISQPNVDSPEKKSSRASPASTGMLPNMFIIILNNDVCLTVINI